MRRNDIVSTLHKLKPVYQEEGFILLGLFGSYARGTQNRFSDIDIVYKLDYDKFSQKYKDGFSKLLRIEDIKKELQSRFKKPVDLVPDNNKEILKDLIKV